MSSQTVVLHLGAHKTGTSLIQKYMRGRKEQSASNGIFAMSRSDGDRLLRWGKADSLAEGHDELAELIKGQFGRGMRNFVISHENTIGAPFAPGKNKLYPRAAERIRNLKNSLGDRNYRVIYYIRSQPAFLESYYLQTVHEGRTHKFAEWRRKLGKPSLSWKPVYEAFCRQFGAENVVLRSFEDDMAQGQGRYLSLFFSSFTAVDPVKFGNFEYEQVWNPSVGDKGLAIALRINKLVNTSEEHKVVRKFLQENFSNRKYPRPVLLKPQEKEDMEKRYQNENKELIALSAQRAASVDA